MNSRIGDAQRSEYSPLFAKHGDSPKSTLQNEDGTLSLRYARLIRNLLLPTNQFSIYDVGCGIGDLHRYLLDQGFAHSYSGSDVVPGMVQLIEHKYPEARVSCGDFLMSKDEKHDYFVASGIFNLPGQIPPDEWWDFCVRVIQKMYAHATCAISFNFLTSYRTFSDPRLAYFDPCQIFDFCQRKLSRFVHLDQASPLFEATITVYAPAYVRASFPQKDFAKYFPKDE